MKALVFILLPLLAQAQTDERWRLLPDSTVNLPFTDLRTVVAYRMASDDMRRSCVLELVARRHEADALRAALKERTTGEEAAQAAAERCVAELDRTAAERDRWHTKAKRRGTVVAVLTAMLAAFTLVTLAP